MIIAEFQNVYKEFQRLPVLMNLNFQIADRDFVAIVGQIGSGKSTILRILAGLESISQGNLLLCQKNANKMHPKERNIAMMFEKCDLLQDMTVYENLEFGLKIRKVPKLDRTKIVDEVCTKMQLNSLKNTKAKDLTYPQRQLVCLSRVLVRTPTMFLLDEPLSVISLANQQDFLKKIAILHKNLNLPFVMATKDESQAKQVANKIIYLKLGQIQEIVENQPTIFEE